MKIKDYYLILLAFFSVQLNAQTISTIDTLKKINWGCYITSLPTIIGSHETYSITQGIFRHKYAIGHRKWGINYKVYKVFKIGNRESILQGVDYYLMNRNNDFYSILLSSIDKEKLNNKMEEMKYLNLNDSLLKKYLDRDTLKIRYNEFNTRYSKIMDELSGVIDGAVFNIYLDLIKSKKDTISYLYSGNLYDGVKDLQVKNFFLYYDLKKEFKVFANLRIKDYFSDDNLYRILLRYIAYSEDTFKRNLDGFSNDFLK